MEYHIAGNACGYSVCLRDLTCEDNSHIKVINSLLKIRKNNNLTVICREGYTDYLMILIEWRIALNENVLGAPSPYLCHNP